MPNLRKRILKVEQGTAERTWSGTSHEHAIQATADVMGILSELGEYERRRVVRCVMAFYGIAKEHL